MKKTSLKIEDAHGELTNLQFYIGNNPPCMPEIIGVMIRMDSSHGIHQAARSAIHTLV